jgi:hypothetical protein
MLLLLLLLSSSCFFVDDVVVVLLIFFRSSVLSSVLTSQGTLSSRFVLQNADAMRLEPRLRLDELTRAELQALMLALSLRPLTMIVWPTFLMRRHLARHFRHVAHCDQVE